MITALSIKKDDLTRKRGRVRKVDKEGEGGMGRKREGEWERKGRGRQVNKTERRVWEWEGRMKGRTDGEEERRGRDGRRQQGGGRKASNEGWKEKEGRGKIIPLCMPDKGSGEQTQGTCNLKNTLTRYVAEDPGAGQGRAGVTFPVSILRPYQSDPTLSKLRCPSALLRPRIRAGRGS